MRETVIVEAVRTAVGKRNGGLSGMHPADLSAVVSRLVEVKAREDTSGLDISLIKAGSIVGVVTDAATGRPLAAATVHALAREETVPFPGVSPVTQTDAEGRYTLSAVPPGKWSLLVEADGYDVQSVPDVVATSGGETILDVRLKAQQ